MKSAAHDNCQLAAPTIFNSRIQKKTEMKSNTCGLDVNLRPRSKTQIRRGGMLLVVGCLTSQQHASVSGMDLLRQVYAQPHQDKNADQTLHLTQSQYTDTMPTSPSADPTMPGAWQGSHWIAHFISHSFDSIQKNPHSASGN